ncbi:hypothetical protein [Ruminococcus flavefaciens]|uniref:DUF5105 domain-containing protein n=1 Tax=Ruminococcus flavefaciens TaxID=1265 RepID=A0A1M7JSS2_RUMFL|nr:hypothetical protein [Ruminococcus flavefaciens]SHM56038.1 hypothetical protein SAMN04487860_106196 [Ruminococcus flavefaciens]
MKRIIAGIIAFTTVLCAFTGCGPDTADEAEETTTVETTTVSEKETTEAATDADSTEASFEAIVKEFLDAYNERDYQKTFEMQMPDGIMKVIKTIAEIENAKDEKEVSEDTVIKDYQEYIYGDSKVNFKEIKDIESVDESELFNLKSSFGMYEWLVKFINEHEDEIASDPEMLDEEADKLSIDDIAAFSNISEAYRVTMQLEYEKTGLSYEGRMYLVKLNGAWKINTFEALGERTRTSQKQLEVPASSIAKAQMTAWVEMDVEGEIPDGKYCFIISSDESKNHNIPEWFDTELFCEKTESYFESINDTEWFSVICNGIAYTTAYVKTRPENISRYPQNFDNSLEDINDLITDDMSFDEMYDICVKAIDDK